MGLGYIIVLRRVGAIGRVSQIVSAVLSVPVYSLGLLPLSRDIWILRYFPFLSSFLISAVASALMAGNIFQTNKSVALCTWPGPCPTHFLMPAKFLKSIFILAVLAEHWPSGTVLLVLSHLIGHKL